MKGRWKKGLFIVGAVVLSLGVLGVAEGVLRLAGVGAEGRAVFVPVAEAPEYQVLNPVYLRRYFGNGFEPTVAYNPFRPEKPAGTFRVVVLGGSSAEGFPYRFYLGFPARLERRLAEYAAGQRVEVLNLGITAVNSYTLWDLKEEVAALAPDAVIVYAGHNEYYGAFGAGSSMSPAVNRVGVKRLVLRLKHLALYQSLERLLRRATPPTERSGTLMSRAIRDAEILLDGPTYRAGLDQYARNLRDVFDYFRAAGIPVYAGTVASNLYDQVPLGDTAGAYDVFMEGRRLFEAGDTTAALAQMLRAKELDEIRFRAPEAVNAVLRELAGEGLATLVDVQALARARSENGIEDNSFFADHLHPNWLGYDAIAGAFFEALRDHPNLQASGLTPVLDGWPRPDAFERSYGMLQVFSIQAGYPFNYLNTRGDEEMALMSMLIQFRNSRHYLDSLTHRAITNAGPPAEDVAAANRIARSRGDTLIALQTYQSLLYWRPFDEALADEAVAYAARVSTRPEHLAVAREIAVLALNRTGAARHLNALAAVSLRQGRAEDAARLLALAEAREPGAEGAQLVRAQLDALRDSTDF